MYKHSMHFNTIRRIFNLWLQPRALYTKDVQKSTFGILLMYKEPITTGIALVLTIRKVGKLHKTIFQILGCRELGIRKVEKCLQTRLSTRAEHSCKWDVQLRILFVPVGKEHFLHTRMFLWFLKRNRPRDKTDSKLIRKFPKTKS